MKEPLVATTETTKKPALTGITSDERAYATRYRQGGRTVFGLSLTPGQLISMIARPDPSIPSPGNRAIRENHAKQFAEYYLNHADWVVPSLILRAPSIFKFEAGDDAGPGQAAHGVLSWARRDSGRIQILDGQHRILGFHIAIGLIQQRIEKARDHRNEALKMEDGNKQAPAVVEAEKALKAANALMDRFDSEQVSIDIHVTDDTTAYRQMFYDIADNALGITASVKARFDTRKVANRALSTVLTHALLKERVDLENDRLARGSMNWMTAKHVGDVVRAAQVGVDGRLGRKMERDLSEQEIAGNAMKFLDSLLVAFPQLKALQVGQVDAQTLRETSLLGSPQVIRALAGVSHQLLSDKHGWNRDMLVEYFKALDPHMASSAHADSIWARIIWTDKDGNQTASFNRGSFYPNGRRQDIKAIEDLLVDWAILGKKGAPWVWEKPAPEPAKPKTEDELLLEEQIEADPVLGELLAAQLLVDQNPPKRAARKR